MFRMNWLSRFMYGRHGTDHLSVALLVLSVIMAYIGGAANLTVLLVLSYVPLGYSFFRVLSRNTVKRRMENYRFVTLFGTLFSWLRYLIGRIKDLPTHRIFKCPNCKAKLRVPRGKGKICITCTRCRTELIRKT